MCTILLKMNEMDKYDVHEIETTNYSHPSVLNSLILKKEDHFEDFDRVMKSFDVEMVSEISRFETQNISCI